VAVAVAVAALVALAPGRRDRLAVVPALITEVTVERATLLLVALVELARRLPLVQRARRAQRLAL
jgi:hypothetical protein